MILSTLDAARRDKSLTENCCRVLFLTCWHKFQMIFNVRIIASSQFRQTLAVAARRVWCRHGFTNLSRRTKATSASNRRPSALWVLTSAGKLIRYLHGSYFLPYRSADIFLFCFLSAISVTRLSSSLNALSSTSWVDTPLTADWLQVCFGTRPRLSFLKRFWKITYPTFNGNISKTFLIIFY